jgi:hypothetical protein
MKKFATSLLCAILLLAAIGFAGIMVFPTDLPPEVADLLGKWERPNTMRWNLSYVVEEILPITGELRAACEAPGYTRIIDEKVKRAADEIITGFPETKPANVILFVARVTVIGETNKGEIKQFFTIARVTFDEDTKEVTLTMKYPILQGHNDVSLILNPGKNFLSAVSTGIDRGRNFRNSFTMKKIS